MGELYNRFESDSIVYALCHTANNMSAVRDVPCKGQLYRVRNNMFWRSINDMIKLGQEYCFQKLVEDAQEEKEESYLYTILNNYIPNMSEQAKTVLYLVDDLLIDSMENRGAYHLEKPELNLQAWDCGWYQLSRFWRYVYPEQYKAIKKEYKKLEEELRPLVYKLGFLKNNPEELLCGM